MSTSTKFLRAEAGRQPAFGTPATPDFKLPFVGEYEDLQEEHEAEWDQGTWTPTTIVEQVASFARVTLNGAMFFELLPVLLSAGFGAISPTDNETHFTYDDEVDPSAVGSPVPYTFLLGGDEDLGGTGPAVRVQDTFLESFTLAGNLNSKEVSLQSTWFGLQVDDNSGAGFAFQGAALPSNLGMMKTLLGGLQYQDASTTGGDFTTMTSFSGVLLDWSLTVNTGLAPLWAADENQLTYAGVRHNEPSVEFTPVIRTNSTTYAAVKGKANSRTFQELLLNLAGGDQRDCKWLMTGRWLPNFVAHGRAGDEVVMQPTFRCSTPHTQTTTPHWFGWELDTEWEHPSS